MAELGGRSVSIRHLAVCQFCVSRCVVVGVALGLKVPLPLNCVNPDVLDFRLHQ